MTQNKQYTKQHKNLEECGLCPVFVGFTLAFALQLRTQPDKLHYIKQKILLPLFQERLFNSFFAYSPKFAV